MTSDSEQVYHDLSNRVRYWTEESDITYTNLIGVLELIKSEVISSLFEEMDRIAEERDGGEE